MGNDEEPCPAMQITTSSSPLFSNRESHPPASPDPIAPGTKGQDDQEGVQQPYFVQGDPLSQIQDGAQLPAGLTARGRQIAGAMAADPELGVSALNWSDRNLVLPLVNGALQNGRVSNLEANVLSRAVGTRYALAPAAAPSWLNHQLGGMNPVPSGRALHSMATSVMYGLFGSVGRR